MTDLYERIAAACAGSGDDAMVVVEAHLAPESPAAKVSPPTYPQGSKTPEGDDTRYVIERRLVDGREAWTVLLDSYQSQAHRTQEALREAHSAGRLAYPLFELSQRVDDDRVVRLTSLDVPHRYADAYLRDSEIDGTPFDRTAVGKALQLATADDATALYERSPESLVYGAWNSHRPGRQAKFPRVYRSEVVGLDPVFGARQAGRMDPLNLTGAAARNGDGDWAFAVTSDGRKTKGEKLSELGHGHIAPSPAPGGVTISEALRLASVSFAGLRRLRFGAAPAPAVVAARVTLAALALAADRLAFAQPSLWLRSGSDLVLVREEVAFLCRGGEREPISVDADTALALFEEAREAAAEQGLAMASDVITVQPRPNLAEAIRYAYLRAVVEETV